MSGFAMTLSLDSTPISEVLSKVEHLADKKNTFELLDEIGAYLDSSTAQRFQDSVGPDGKSWKESQRAINEGGKTLVDKAFLRDSFTHNVEPDAQSMAQGSNAIYAAIQHFGGQTGRNKKTKIDAHPIVGINSEDEANIADITDDWAIGLLK